MFKALLMLLSLVPLPLPPRPIAPTAPDWLEWTRTPKYSDARQQVLTYTWFGDCPNCVRTEQSKVQYGRVSELELISLKKEVIAQ